MGKTIAGFDVSKGWVDVSLAGEAHVNRLENTAEAIGQWLDRVAPGMAAYEPTGGYERVLQDALKHRGITFIRVHPNEVVAYRKSRAIKAKTDVIDARLIAAFAADELIRRGASQTILGDEAMKELAARRSQLVATLQAERCRLATVCTEAVKNSLNAAIRALQSCLDEVEAALTLSIAENPEMQSRSMLMQSLRGIGPIVSTTLIAELPELGLLSGKQIASLVGLAPQTRQSGKNKGKERVAHGRPNVRRVLFMAARAAIRHPSPLKTFYDRLVIENKRPGKVALTALMRKMLITLNAIVREGKPWAAINEH
jgi:transposase